MTTLLTVNNISKTVKHSVPVTILNDINFRAGAGEFITLIGPSGSGKTTLLNIIGLIDSPSQGYIYIERQRIYSITNHHTKKIRRKNIGFVYQTFRLIPHLTIYENLDYFLVINNKPSSYRKKQIKHILTLVGISKLTDHFPKQLSAGQLQRAAIARAISHEPKLLLADEPTSSLDSENAHNIFELFRSLCKQYGTTCIVATHDLQLINQQDRILNIKDGVLQ